LCRHRYYISTQKIGFFSNIYIYIQDKWYNFEDNLVFSHEIGEKLGIQWCMGQRLDLGLAPTLDWPAWILIEGLDLIASGRITVVCSNYPTYTYTWICACVEFFLSGDTQYFMTRYTWCICF
jgi:hypothetical protein